MNYLAHAYLSFGFPDIVVGNLISDFVKGKHKFDYPPAIQTGITLHRAIDTFTDTHPATRRAKSYFKADYGLYSAPLTDIAYDHFLATDTAAFATPKDLASFAGRVYDQLAGHSGLFPDRFARLFPSMREHNWLYGYRLQEGIFASFAGLARRATYMPDHTQACRLFELHYQHIKECYMAFFPEVCAFAAQTLHDLAPDLPLRPPV